MCSSLSAAFFHRLPNGGIPWGQREPDRFDKINDEENLKQYEQDEMEGAYDANLAKIPGKGNKTLELLKW